MNTKKRQALEALLQCRTRREAAEMANVSPDTLRRWLKDDKDFRQEFEARQSELLSEAALAARRLITKAFYTLEKMLTDEDIAEGVRASAARSILEHSARVIELQDLSRKLDEIEAWKDEQEAHNG